MAVAIDAKKALWVLRVWNRSPVVCHTRRRTDLVSETLHVTQMVGRAGQPALASTLFIPEQMVSNVDDPKPDVQHQQSVGFCVEDKEQPKQLVRHPQTPGVFVFAASHVRLCQRHHAQHVRKPDAKRCVEIRTDECVHVT